MPINLAALGLDQSQSDPRPEAEDVAQRLAKQLVEGRSRADLLKLAGLIVRNQGEYEQERGDAPEGMPQTPDELWHYVVRRYGVRIGRVAVCEDHDTPFDYICAGFFGWYPNVFGIGPRGGGKSYDQALLHDLNAHWKPGSESATFGAVEGQAKRVYAAFKTFVDPDAILGKSLMSETNYKPVEGMPYGSKVEVLGGTVAAVNSPHPQFPHSDEVEIMRADTWKESRNLAADKVTPDGRRIRGQNMATSTMKWKGGRVWQIWQAFLRARERALERHGPDPACEELVKDQITKTAPFYVLIWCLFEVAQQVPNCREAPENADLPEWEPGLDRDRCKCDCVLPSTEIAINGELRGGFRRRYDGPVVDLVTAGGKTLSVTPNHPVLTARGWVAAGLLEVGDHVVSSSRCDAVAAADLDQVPALAEDVFESLRVQAPSGGAHAVSPLGVDFHGDGVFEEGEVDFVGADRELPLEGDAARAQHRGEFLFPSGDRASDPGCAQVTQQGVDRHADLEREGSRGLAGGVAVEDLLRGLEDDATTQDAELAEPVLENRLGDPGASSDRLVLLASAVGGDDLVGDQRVRLGSQQTALAELSLERPSAGSDALGCVGDGHPGLVELDRLVEVKRRHWAGHVYNFSSSMESYSANSIIVHNCNEVINGQLEQLDDDGRPLPRTLASECRGRFYRSRGHRSRGEVIQLFLQNDERTWNAQQLCRETETEGLYIPSFSRQRHGLSVFPLDPANGPFYSGTDWGFTDEAAVLWIQYLERAVEAIRYDGTKIVVPRGARVAISERTVSQKTATELGQEAILREVKLASMLSVARITVRRRWADLQGAGDRRDWAKMGLRTARYSTRNFDEHVKEWRGLVDANRFFVVVDEDRFTGMGCPVLCEQLEGWREEDGKESRELPQHVVSAGRYVVYGMHDIYHDSGAQSPEQQEAQKLQSAYAHGPAAKPYYMPTAGMATMADVRRELELENDWRARV